MVHCCYLRPYLGIESVSCCLLLGMARVDIDWNTKQSGQPFQVLMPCPRQQRPPWGQRKVAVKQESMYGFFCLSGWTIKWPLAEVRLYSISSSELYWGILCTDNKALQGGIDIKQQQLRDIALSFSMRISKLNKKLVSAVRINGCLCSTQ